MSIRLLLFVLSLWSALWTGVVRADTAPTILVFGDSLSAGYGIDVNSGWVQLLRDRLKDQGYPHQIVNGSVSGETTAGGLSRLPATLQRHPPDIVLLELGANDGLRGLPLETMRKNLEALVAASQDTGATVVLFEMRLPPNYGSEYTERFRAVFHAVAEDSGAVLLPFFMASIARDPANFQEDRAHPTAAAQPALLDAIWPTLEPLLQPADERVPAS